LSNIGLPVKYLNSVLDDFKVESPAQRKLKVWAQFYIENIEAHKESGKGAVILGSPGNGKTMISCIIANVAHSKGYSVRFTTLAAYVRLNLDMFRLQSAWEKMKDQDAYFEWKDKVEFCKKLRTEYEFLVLDDVGKEHTTGSKFAEDEIDFLLRRRAHLALPTILTSNCPINEWSDTYSSSMASFIREACEVTAVNGDDYRRKDVR
jgi:DNA replication protein DnaC